MATISTFAHRIFLLDALISVDSTEEELARRLQQSWPSDLAAEKEELQTILSDAIVAENIKHWERACHQLHYCLGILITNKKSIPQELLLWLVKRICVPLAFISQFRLPVPEYKVAYKALSFMLKFVWFECDYGDGGLTGVQMMLKNRMAAMAASVLYDAKDGAEKVHSEMYKFLSTEECVRDDLKARCCELLCVQYYRLGRIGDVWFWHGEWERSIECIADSTKRAFQERECLLVEASLYAEYGTDDQKAEEMIAKLEEVSKMDGDDLTGMSVHHVIRKIRLGRSGDAESRDEAESRAQADLIAMQSCMEDNEFENDTLLVLDQKVQRAMERSARYEDAIRYLQEMIDHVNRKPSYINNPVKLASGLGELLYNQAVCHSRLFQEKELKYFIDCKENIGSHDKNSTGYTGALLKLCAHHCLSPCCQHESHDCPEEEEDDLSADEELINLGHHELESPTEFFAKRQIESDGNNLTHMETAIRLLDEALDHAKKAGSDIFYVAKVQSFLARTHLLVAESKCRRLVGYESWPLPELITPRFLVSKDCHTIQQVRAYLKRNGSSPDESFHWSHNHYRQCAEMFTKHLDSLKDYSEKWILSIEKQKDLYVKLQNMLFQGLGFFIKLRDVLSKLNLPIEEVLPRESEFAEIAANIIPEALLWSERGRARLLEFQLNRRVLQQPVIIPSQVPRDYSEPSSTDLSAFDLHDEAAWDVIRSSLDACGEGTVFLEYFCEDKSAWKFREKTLGKVYGVKKASGKTMEPLLMNPLPGDPMELQSLVKCLHEAIHPPPERKYDDEELIKYLEKLYVQLITPYVAEFLKEMKPEHKLVICPSQIFTEVPFAALRNPAEKSPGKGYLFQSHTISITPSLRVLKYNMERYTALQKMELMEGEGASVAIGDPRYIDPKRRLKQTGVEVESIASLFPNRCEQIKYWNATVENLVQRARLPSERSRSQAFVHIAAHCDTGNVDYKQGKLMLTELDCTDKPSSSSTTPVGSDGILSAEDVVKSDIEWRAHMIVLSACGSGKGEIKAEGVLNLPRAFMVAGVPCSVVSQWNVEDGSTAQLMKFFYQRLLKGIDVATALRSSMQQMLDNGASIKQWAPFMVWGLPTVCVPDELLSEDAGAALLQSGKELIRSHRHSDALHPLKKSLELMKAKKDHTDDDALAGCLWWLAVCEESSYHLAQKSEKTCLTLPSGSIEALKFASKHRLDDLKADQFRHLDAAIQYLNEALEHAKDGGFSFDPPTQPVLHKRLGQMHHRRGILCYVQIQDELHLPDMVTSSIQAVLDSHQAQDISAEGSWWKSFAHLIECAKLCSHDMERSAIGSEPWMDAATLGNVVLSEMREILRWRQGYLQLIKQHLTDRHKRLTSDDKWAVLSYTQEFRSLMSRVAEKEMWLSRMYTPPWEERSRSLPTVPIDDATWDLFKMDSWKETRTLARGCGVDVVVEYFLDIFDQSPQKFLYIFVMFQDRPPQFFAKEVNKDRLDRMMSAHNNLESGSFLNDLEYLHEILIKPILEDPMINTMHQKQKLVFIPCELLEGVPFALLRDGAQPDGEGYLIQSHTISMVPSLRILEHCSQCLQDLQSLPLVPAGSNASLVLSNPANPKEDMEAGGLGPALIVASKFPTQCKAVHGSDSTVDSLLEWANQLSSSTKEYCQAFFHIEAEIDEEIAENHGMPDGLSMLMFGINLQGNNTSHSKYSRLSSEAIEKCGFQWRVRIAAVRACQSANEHMQKEAVLHLARAFLMKGVPCAVMSNCLVDDVSSHVFFEHLYTSLKDGEDVATAVRYAMLEMKKDGFQLDQWGAFAVFGVPTARLPPEMLRSNEELLQNEGNLVGSFRDSEPGVATTV